MYKRQGLLNAVFRQSQGHRLAVGTNAGGLDRAAVVHEAFKFHDAGLEVEVNDVLVVTNGGHNFQGHADGLHFKHAGSGGSDGEAGDLGLVFGAYKVIQNVVPVIVVAAAPAAYVVGKFRGFVFGGVPEFADDFNLGGFTGLGGHAGSGENIGTLLLGQAAHQHLEGAFVIDARQGHDAGSRILLGGFSAVGAVQQVVHGVLGNGVVARAVAAGGEAVDQAVAVRIGAVVVHGPAAYAARGLGEVIGNEAGAVVRAAAQEGAAVVADGERSNDPVKAEFFRVFLGHFHELGHDAHLLGFAAGVFNELFDQVQVAGGIADDQGGVAVDKECRGAFREADAALLQQAADGGHGLEAGGAFTAAAEGVFADVAAAVADGGAESGLEARRHGEGALVEIHVIAAGRKDGDGIVFHLLAQAGVAADEAEHFQHGNVGQLELADLAGADAFLRSGNWSDFRDVR